MHPASKHGLLPSGGCGNDSSLPSYVAQRMSHPGAAPPSVTSFAFEAMHTDCYLASHISKDVY